MASALTMNGLPQALPRATLDPSNVWMKMFSYPASWDLKFSGQFAAMTTIWAKALFYAFFRVVLAEDDIPGLDCSS
jgi:hypothetical protein